MPPRRGDAPRPPVVNPERERAEVLVKSSGLPLSLAFRVVRKELSLSEAVAQLAQHAEVENLIQRHGLNRALATQVARGEVKLEDVLRKMRQKAHLESTAQRSGLTDALTSGATMTFAVHGAKNLRGRVVGVDPYDVHVIPEEGPQLVLPKVQIKYLYPSEQYKSVRKGLKYDAARRQVCEPILRPQERYGCSDQRLFRYLDSNTQVCVTVLEGDQFHGRVVWMTRWEFGLKVEKAGPVIVVFRHALADIGEAR